MYSYLHLAFESWMEIQNLIDKIEKKIKLLAQKLERCQEDYNAVKRDNQILIEKLNERDQAVRNLQTKLKESLETIEQQEKDEPVHKKNLKMQIDQYIREIDKCIEWLNNN